MQKESDMQANELKKVLNAFTSATFLRMGADERGCFIEGIHSDATKLTDGYVISRYYLPTEPDGLRTALKNKQAVKEEKGEHFNGLGIDLKFLKGILTVLKKKDVILEFGDSNYHVISEGKRTSGAYESDNMSLKGRITYLPPVPDLQQKAGKSKSFPGLLDALTSIAPGVARDDYRATLNGIHFDKKGSRLTATDGHILFCYPVPKLHVEAIAVTNIQQFKRMVKVMPNPSLRALGLSIVLEDGDWAMVISTLEGTFPPVDKVIPKVKVGEVEEEFFTSTSDFLKACKGIVGGTVPGVLFDGRHIHACESAGLDRKSTTDLVGIKGPDGFPVPVLFNIEYFIKLCTFMEGHSGDIVSPESSMKASAAFGVVSADGYTALLMPVKMAQSIERRTG